MRTAGDQKPLTGQRLVRAVWLLLGFVLVGLGVIGVFVPLMPTTIFIILAAACFARSSSRLEGWLLNHPRFGPSLRAWREQGAIPTRAKSAACVGMALGFGMFWFGVHPGLAVAVAVGAIMTGCAAWIISRPSPRKLDDGIAR